MMIGILEAGRNREALKAAHGTYPQMIRSLLSGADPALGFRSYAVVDEEFPDAADECDAWLVTGSRHTAFDRLPWMLRLEGFLRNVMSAGRPLVGICFGHQILAQALGGAVERSAQGWGLGPHDYDIVETAPWMDGTRRAIRLNAVHQDQVTVPPEGARVLARSPFCPAAVLSYGERAVTFQAHPEFETAFVAALVDELYRNGLGKEEADGARERIERSPGDDAPTVALWIVRFLRYASASATRAARLDELQECDQIR